MEIVAENIGKKFNREWIFRNLSFKVNTARSLAITGPNGSGKSTLLQLIAGALPPTEGTIVYQKGKLNLAPDYFYKHISYSAPYFELIEEMTIRELVTFHTRLKPFANNLSENEFIARIFLEQAADKEVRYLSSGMKQRLKLGLAFFSDTPVLLLDEPTSNLDSKGIDWYRTEINNHLQKRIVIICSNQRYEYDFCDDEIKIKE